MPLIPPVVVTDAASRERSEEAAVFSLQALGTLTQHCRRRLLRIDLFILKNS